MGTFEKLGILVIVVIIVMILAVAIYQWGGAATEPATPTPDLPDPLTIRYLEDLEQQRADADERALDDPAPGADLWPGGIPKVYVVQPRDKVWVLVVKRWKLKDSFIAAIAAANPAARLEKLLPGHKLRIPDPAPYVRKPGTDRRPTPGRTRLYEVQIGDTLESIAYRHLGARRRWKDIVELNPGLNPKRLMEGQEISLPLK
jgi:nucleoid-associated protein YgaU